MLKYTYLKYILLTALMIGNSTAFSAVIAYLNQNTYYEGDPITLTLETNKNNNAQPDLTSLQKNFDILGTSASSQINIMNDKRSFKKTWTIELQPKIKGDIQIPIIQVGKEKTEILTLSIIDLPAEIKAETSKHISIESSIGLTSNETYVQQQIPYTVKLFYDSSMISGDINPLKIKNAVIEQLGRDKRYRVIKDGKRINIVEKNYVISPEKSGSLYIPATTVKGRIALSGGDSPRLRKRIDETDMLNRFFNNAFGDGFFSRRSQGPSKPFTASSKAITVNVLPVPAAFTGSAWLPAKDLTITDSWAKNPPNLKVGEPVTRTLLLQAKGLAGSQIPQISIPKPLDVKIYHEPAKSETRTDGKTVYGIQQLVITYIPNNKGELIIPKVAVDWWNIKTKKQQTFIVPEWNLNVVAGLQSTIVEDEPLLSKEDSVTEQVIETQKPLNQESFYTWKIIFTSGVIALLLGIFVYLINQQKNKRKQASTDSSLKKARPVDTSALYASLIKNCNLNDNDAAANALIKLAQGLWKDNSIQNLGILASHLSSDADVIKELEQSLYAPDNKEWDGKALKELALKGLMKKEDTYTDNSIDVLAPLYPN